MASPSVKRKCRYTINNAIRDGLIKRPDKCSCCGKYPPRGKDGRSLIQAHHPDYRKPKLVVWECASCHRREHQ